MLWEVVVGWVVRAEGCIVMGGWWVLVPRLV